MEGAKAQLEDTCHFGGLAPDTVVKAERWLAILDSPLNRLPYAVEAFNLYTRQHDPLASATPESTSSGRYLTGIMDRINVASSG